MVESLLQECQRLAKGMQANRQTWESHWQAITDWLIPAIGRHMGEMANDGKSRNSNIVDGSAMRALRRLASGMHSGLTSPARPWFQLKFQDPMLMEYAPAKAWLDDAEDALYADFARSNFYTSVHSIYEELAAFGSAALYQYELPNGAQNFKVITCGTYAVGLGEDGRINSFWREFHLSARACREQYGEENLSTSTKGILKTAPDKLVKIHHLVYPNKDMVNDSPWAKDAQYASVFWEHGAENDKVLQKSGYFEFPVHFPRWWTAGDEVYGRSPGMDALPDVKMLQAMARSEIIGTQKSIDPPMIGPANHKGRMDMRPGVYNQVNMMGGNQQVLPLFPQRLDIMPTTAKIADLRKGIEQTFHNDLFLIFEQAMHNTTATEIIQRANEKMLLFGPVVERQINELLIPVVSRAFNMMARGGRLPMPPPEIGGADLKIDFTSMLAQAQRAQAFNSIAQLASFIASLAQLWPGATDMWNSDVAIEEVGKALGTPERLLRTRDEVAEMRQQRALQQAAMQKMQTDMVGMQAAQIASQTDTSGKNLLTDSMGEAAA